MLCPNCKSKNTKILNSRTNEYNRTVRWGKCRDCGVRYKTIEMIVGTKDSADGNIYPFILGEEEDDE